MGAFKASWLALPLVGFIIVTLLVPIFSLIRLSVYDSTVADALPKTAEALQAWQGTEIPSITTFEILGEELTTARETRELGRIASRVNRVLSGSRSLISKTARRLAREDAPDVRSAFIAIDEDWGQLEIWHALQQATNYVFQSKFPSSHRLATHAGRFD